MENAFDVHSPVGLNPSTNALLKRTTEDSLSSTSERLLCCTTRGRHRLQAEGRGARRQRVHVNKHTGI